MLIAGAIDFVVFVQRAQRLPDGGGLRRVRHQRPRGQRRGRPGAVQRGLRARPGRPRPCRTRRSPAWTSSPPTATSRSGRGAGSDRWIASSTAARHAAARRRAGGRRPRRCSCVAVRRHARAEPGREAQTRATAPPSCCRARHPAPARRRGRRPAGAARHPLAGARRRAGAAGLRLATASSAAPRRSGGRSQRLEALATWTESLRDTIAGAVGLEQAIPASAARRGPGAPAQLRPAGRPAADPRCRCRTRSQLFADELDDPSADLIVAALVLNARLRGPGLREVLGALAESAREELDMRRRVEAERRRTRRSVQIVVGSRRWPSSLGLAIFNPDVRGAVRHRCRPGRARRGRRPVRAGFFWLRRLARFEMPGAVPDPQHRRRLAARATGWPRACSPAALAGLGVFLLVQAVPGRGPGLVPPGSLARIDAAAAGAARRPHRPLPPDGASRRHAGAGSARRLARL